MIDITAIAETLSAIKTASEIVKSIKSGNEAKIQQEKIIELYQVIISAQESIIATKEQYMKLIEYVKELEKKLNSKDDWDVEKQKYKLAQWKHDITVYVPKDCENSAKAMEALCVNCFNEGYKSILQSNFVIHTHVIQCPKCKFKAYSH